MIVNNGKKVGGYSLESYEPTDIKYEEKYQNENFIKNSFENKLPGQNAFGLVPPTNYHYKTYYSKRNNLTLRDYNLKIVNNSNDNYSTIYAPNNNTLQSYNLNNNQIIPNIKVSPTVYQYSNETKIIYPSENRTVINYSQNYNSPQINYLTEIAHPAQENKTKIFVQEMRPAKTLYNFAPNKNLLLMTDFNQNNFAIPMNTIKPMQTVLPKYNLTTRKVLPLYPTVTLRKINIYYNRNF